MKLETVMENVLYQMLLEGIIHIMNITSGRNMLLHTEFNNLHKKIDWQCQNWFNKERSILVITTYEGAPDKRYIKIYEMDDLAGEIKLLRTCNIDEYKPDIAWEYLSKRYQVHWYSDYGNDSHILEEDINGETLYDEDWCNNWLKFDENNENKIKIEKINL